MLKNTAALLLLLASTSASIISPGPDLQARQSCPGVHVFGARETTVSPGYGTAGTVVNLVLGAYSGSTAEAINYPACGGQSSCGGVSYANSVQAGVRAVASAVNAFNTRCPNTKLVLVGYSQVCGVCYLLSEFEYLHSHARVDKSSMMHSVVVVIRMRVLATPQSRYNHRPLIWSKPRSSWEIHAISTVCHIMSVHAERTGYVWASIVLLHRFPWLTTSASLHLVQPASNAHRRQRFSLTAILQILIAATGTTRIRTRAMVTSTARQRSISSRVS